MATQKKKAPMALFNVLKSVVDYKAKQIRQAISVGDRAKEEEKQVCAQIASLRQFISSNRYDPAEVKEAEADLVDYEHQAAAIRGKIVQAETIKQQNDMQWVDKFNSTYRFVLIQPKIYELNQQLTEIEGNIAKIEHGIDICELNMAIGVYSDEVAQQAQVDMEKYQREYEVEAEKWRNVMRQIKELEK